LEFVRAYLHRFGPAWTIFPMRFLLAFAQGGLLSPLLPLLRDTFHVSYGELGLLTAMPGLSSVVMDVVATSLLQRRPLLSVLLQGIVVTGIGLLCCVLAPSFFWLVGAQMLLGLGSSVTRLAGLTVVVAATPREAMGRANSLLEFAAIAGLAISPTLSGLAAALLHWRAAFGLSMLFVAGAFVWVLYTRQELGDAVSTSGVRRNPHSRTAVPASPTRVDPPTKSSQSWAVGIAYLATFMLSFTWAGFISMAMPLFGGEVVGISPSTLGTIFTAGLVVDLGLLLPIGWLSDRLEYRAVLAPAMLLMAAMLVWLPAASSPAALLAVSVGLHTGFAAWGMPSAVLALLTRGDSLTRTMSIYRLLVDGAVVIAPWLIGVLIGQYGYGLPARLAAAIVAGTALLVAYGLRVARGT
jgi:predicted MFS family arabinose efflux permease